MSFKYLTENEAKELFEIRNIMDGVVDSIGAVDEASFNAAAAEINAKAVAIRVWIAGTAEKPREYKRGAIRKDPQTGVPHWALHDHTSVPGQELQPSLSPTMWAHCHGTTPETASDFVAEGHNPYMDGHYCVENGAVYLCGQDNTVHAPSVYPQAWTMVE